MLKLHKDLPKACSSDKTAIERQIAATDRQIDQLVYELYGLTEEGNENCGGRKQNMRIGHGWHAGNAGRLCRNITARARRSDRIVLLSAVTLLSSCATAPIIRYETRYVVLDSVPTSPTFTVVPASASSADQELALTMTQALVGCGVKVLARPANSQERVQYRGAENQLAHGYVESGADAASGGVAVRSDQQSELTRNGDPMALVDSTKADYVFISSSTGNRPWFQLVKRETKQILYAGVIPMQYSNDQYIDPLLTSTAVSRILEGAGLKSDK